MMFKAGETNIICTNLAESRNFYETILGFTFIEEDQGAIRLKCGHQYFLLLPFAKEKQPPADYCDYAEVSFDLSTENLQDAYTYLVEKDVVIAEDSAEDGMNIVICDPDGLHIEIVSNT